MPDGFARPVVEGARVPVDPAAVGASGPVTRREAACHLCGSCKWSRGRERVFATGPDPESPVDLTAGPDDGSYEWVCQVCGSVARRETVLLLDTVEPS